MIIPKDPTRIELRNKLSQSIPRPTRSHADTRNAIKFSAVLIRPDMPKLSVGLARIAAMRTLQSNFNVKLAAYVNKEYTQATRQIFTMRSVPQYFRRGNGSYADIVDMC